jgi:hypothetical protein
MSGIDFLGLRAFCSNLYPVVGVGCGKFAASPALKKRNPCPWLRSCSVVDVYPLLRNALPWPESSRSTGYTFSQTALSVRSLAR